MTVSQDLIDRRRGREGSAGRVLRTLAGRWRLDRRIPDVASLVGQAVFTPTGRMTSLLRYHEWGDLRLNAGATFAAARRYLYRLIGERIVIEFADRPNPGAVLHDLLFDPSPEDVGLLVAAHRHSCWPDNYDFEMNIRGNDRFETHYRVAGPRKNYEMHTIYEREPARFPDPVQVDL